jgi:hypothetical protein
VFRHPTPQGYAEQQVLTEEDSIAFLAFSDLAPFSISEFQRREAPPKPAFTVRALRARTVNAKGARSELSQIVKLMLGECCDLDPLIVRGLSPRIILKFSLNAKSTFKPRLN